MMMPIPAFVIYTLLWIGLVIVVGRARYQSAHSKGYRTGLRARYTTFHLDRPDPREPRYNHLVQKIKDRDLRLARDLGLLTDEELRDLRISELQDDVTNLRLDNQIIHSDLELLTDIQDAINSDELDKHDANPAKEPS